MKRIVYLAVLPGCDDSPKKVFMDANWYLDKYKPSTPYIKIECKVLETESRFIGERKEIK